MQPGSSTEPRRPQPVTPQLPIYDSAARPHAFFEEWLELWRYRDLVLQWSWRNVKLRYKRSVLGVLWTLLEPLMLMTILAVVFSSLFQPMERFPVYLLAGLLLYTFFSRATLQIVEEIIASKGLAERIYVPRSAFAVAAVITHMVNWLISCIPLAAIMLAFGQPLSLSLVTVPLGMALTAAFALGVGLVVATLGAFFHDFRLTYQVLLSAWFYATPIIYPVDVLPPSVRPWFLANPLLHLTEVVRRPIYEGLVATPGSWLLATAFSLTALLVGWWIFTRWRDAFDYRG